MPYFGDYVYNKYMGDIENYSNSGVLYVNIPWAKASAVPNNVLLMVDCYKPNLSTDFVGGSYKNQYTPNEFKSYFGGESSSVQWTGLINYGGKTTGDVDLLFTPHSKGYMCNMLFADGHVYLTNPFVDPNIILNLNQPYNGKQPITPPVRTGSLGNLYTYATSPGLLTADWMIGPGPYTPNGANGAGNVPASMFAKNATPPNYILGPYPPFAAPNWNPQKPSAN
jgi:prepilin-type processing-associated H-X9-DG protein